MSDTHTHTLPKGMHKHCICNLQTEAEMYNISRSMDIYQYR